MLLNVYIVEVKNNFKISCTRIMNCTDIFGLI